VIDADGAAAVVVEADVVVETVVVEVEIVVVGE
jgi:hypothetical protein